MRLAETTRLDRIGVRTHAAIKPGTTDVLSIYSGKGLSTSDSVCGAIMECLERTGSLWREQDVLVCTEAEARTNGEILGPARFTEPLAQVSVEQPIAWVWVERSGSCSRSLAPAQLVFNGRALGGMGTLPFTVTTSNGLGAAVSVQGAITHALREIIERDVVSCIELLSSHIQDNQIHRLARSMGIELDSGQFRDNLKYVLRVDPATLPEPAAGLVDRVMSAGLTIEIKALPNDFGVPCFAVATAQDVGSSRVLSTAGYAAGYPLSGALVRALLEVCQSRATHFQGGREDDSVVREKRLHEVVDEQGWLFNTRLPSLRFDVLEAYFLPGDDSFACYAERATAVGLGAPHVFVRWPYPGICVARVLVPGVETWHATAGESRLGTRMLKAQRDSRAWMCRPRQGSGT